MLISHAAGSASGAWSGRLTGQSQSAHSHTGHPHASQAPSGSINDWENRIPDVVALNQDGESVHVYRDLVKGKVVAINFIYTSCTALCPLLGANFAKLQSALGDRLGSDVHLITVSTDPVTDTPTKLKAWGAKFGAKPGWTLVTGEKSEINDLLRALTGGVSRQGDHTPAVLIISADGRTWVREYGLASPARLMELLDAAADKTSKHGSHESN